MKSSTVDFLCGIGLVLFAIFIVATSVRYMSAHDLVSQNCDFNNQTHQAICPEWVLRSFK